MEGGCSSKMSGGCGCSKVTGGVSGGSSVVAMSIVVAAMSLAVMTCVLAMEVYTAADSVDNVDAARDDHIVSITGVVVGSVLLAASFLLLGVQLGNRERQMSRLFPLALIIGALAVAGHGLGSMMDLHLRQHADNTSGSPLPIPYDQLPTTAYAVAGVSIALLPFAAWQTLSVSK